MYRGRGGFRPDGRDSGYGRRAPLAPPTLDHHHRWRGERRGPWNDSRGGGYDARRSSPHSEGRVRTWGTPNTSSYSERSRESDHRSRDRSANRRREISPVRRRAASPEPRGTPSSPRSRGARSPTRSKSPPRSSEAAVASSVTSARTASTPRRAYGPGSGAPLGPRRPSIGATPPTGPSLAFIPRGRGRGGMRGGPRGRFGGPVLGGHFRPPLGPRGALAQQPDDPPPKSLARKRDAGGLPISSELLPIPTPRGPAALTTVGAEHEEGEEGEEGEMEDIQILSEEQQQHQQHQWDASYDSQQQYEEVSAPPDVTMTTHEAESTEAPSVDAQYAPVQSTDQGYFNQVGYTSSDSVMTAAAASASAAMPPPSGPPQTLASSHSAAPASLETNGHHSGTPSSAAASRSTVEARPSLGTPSASSTNRTSLHRLSFSQIPPASRPASGASTPAAASAAGGSSVPGTPSGVRPRATFTPIIPKASLYAGTFDAALEAEINALANTRLASLANLWSIRAPLRQAYAELADAEREAAGAKVRAQVTLSALDAARDAAELHTAEEARREESRARGRERGLFVV